MTNILDRMSKVVKAEWNSRFSAEDLPADSAESFEDQVSVDVAPEKEPRSKRRGAKVSARRRGLTDAQQALELLELPSDVTLDDVRTAYRRQAVLLHPRTLLENADQAYAAQTLLLTLTDAYEILELHLLPDPSLEGS